MFDYQSNYINKLKAKFKDAKNNVGASAQKSDQNPAKLKRIKIVDNTDGVSMLSAYERQKEELEKVPKKYVFETSEFGHLSDLKYSQIFNHIFTRYPAEPVKIYEANLDSFLDCFCWKEHDKKFGGNSFV